MMKKRFTLFLAILLVVSMSVLLVGCGKKEEKSNDTGKATAKETTDEETTEDEEEPEEKDYTFENGVYTTKLFAVTVPDGWVIDEEISDEDTARIYRTANAEEYDVFKEAQVRIKISDFAFSEKNGEFNLDSSIENDKQFFENDTPESIIDYKKDGYVGKQLLGKSSSYKNGEIQYINAELWQGDSNNCSKMHASTLYYDSEQQKEIEEIMNSIEFKLAGDLTNEEAETETETGVLSLDLKGCSLELAENEKGWSIESSNDESAELVSSVYGKGYVKIVCSNIYNENNSEVWASNYNENYGGGHTISTVDFNGKTYYTFTPVEGQVFYLTDCSDNKTRVEVKTMFMNAEQISDIMQALVIK